MFDKHVGLAASPVALIPARATTHSTRAVRSGELVSVLRGVYAPAAEWGVLAPWDRYLARVHAATLVYPDGVLCLESAAAARGLPVFGDPGRVHLLADARGRSHTTGAVEVHTSVEPRVLEEIDGVLVTGLADTVVDMARARHNAIALAVADAALRGDPQLNPALLGAVNEGRMSSRGRLRARWPLHRATRLAESPLESVDRAVLEWLGFPPPQLQVWLGGDRVDKWWAEAGIAGESDGDVKYAGPLETATTALRKRHARDARLFRNGARAVPHWGWTEALAADPLHALLVSAGLRAEAPRNTAQLFALRRALRRSDAS
ncbi:hypothetical protein [Microbacterium sp. P04]|uniref:hypothetical protein n=1 Tax=Microbacterium sp. P04 TaxID=3366947 RepID=UPI0037477A98